MTHDEKVQHFIEDMKARGKKESSVAPPALKMLWKLGLSVRPPLFASFGQLVVAAGGFFGVSWGLVMWFLLWDPGMPIALAAGLSLAAGLMFGTMMAWWIRRSARKLHLPSWEDYPAGLSSDDPG
ncbi:MAG: hypothetical protein ACI9KE_002283 [Polyangiales bacterium]|jgi:hypothetical protein